MPEVTGPQVATTSGAADDELHNGDLQEHELLEMHRHPTVRLARKLYTGLMKSAQWSVSVVSDHDHDPDVLETIKAAATRQFLHMRSHIVDTAARGCLMRGWRGYEVVWEFGTDAWTIRKLKPLVHNITSILTDPRTGAFRGFKQRNIYTSTPENLGEVEVDLCLLYTSPSPRDS